MDQAVAGNQGFEDVIVSSMKIVTWPPACLTRKALLPHPWIQPDFIKTFEPAGSYESQVSGGKQAP
jgi:hypothetical protein